METGKKKVGELPRPVLFGDEGTLLRTYEIHAFEPARGIAPGVTFTWVKGHTTDCPNNV